MRTRVTSFKVFCRLGGHARAEKLGKQACSRSASHAARSRWGYGLRFVVTTTRKNRALFGSALREFYRDLVKTKNPALLARDPGLTGVQEYDAFIAAAAETICEAYGWSVPRWVNGKSRVSRFPYFGNAPDGMKVPLLQASPLPFRKRNVFVFPDFMEEFTTKLVGTTA